MTEESVTSAESAKDVNQLTIPEPSFGLFDTIRSVTDPAGLMTDAVKKYGDTMRFKMPDGAVVLTGNPERVRAIFTADPDIFEAPFRSMLEPLLGAGSILFATGSKHKKERKLLGPPFHGDRMRAYGKTMIAISDEVAAGLPEGKSFKMVAAAQSLSLEVILRAIFGVEGHERKERFRAAVVERMAAMSSPLIAAFQFTRRQFAGIGPWARFQRAVKVLDALIFEELEARRSSVEGREDILSLMMSARYDDGSAMSDDVLRDQLVSLLFAGHETTATTLAWVFYLLHRHPEELGKVLAEIDTLGPDPEPEAIAALPYLEAVIWETMRMYPIAGTVARLLKKPLDIGGAIIPEGTTVSVHILMVHMREDVFPEPERFRPERFVGKKYSPFEYLPFGGGARRCLGAAFATYEMKLVIAMLLRKYRFRLAKDAPVKYAQLGVTMGPKGGVPMIIEGRR